MLGAHALGESSLIVPSAVETSKQQQASRGPPASFPPTWIPLPYSSSLLPSAGRVLRLLGLPAALSVLPTAAGLLMAGIALRPAPSSGGRRLKGQAGRWVGQRPFNAQATRSYPSGYEPASHVLGPPHPPPHPTPAPDHTPCLQSLRRRCCARCWRTRWPAPHASPSSQWSAVGRSTRQRYLWIRWCRCADSSHASVGGRWDSQAFQLPGPSLAFAGSPHNIPTLPFHRHCSASATRWRRAPSRLWAPHWGLDPLAWRWPACRCALRGRSLPTGWAAGRSGLRCSSGGAAAPSSCR